MDFETLVVQGIPPKDNELQAVVPPLYLTTTFAQKGVGEFGTYQYTRGANPTRAALESLVAKLEGAKYALAYSTGMSATAAFLSLFKPGEKVLLNSNVYGGTYAYVKEVLPKYNIAYELVDDLNLLTANDLKDEVKGIFIETPSNPMLRVTDIKKISALAHEKGIVVGIDNTFLTPYYQNILELGADVGIYSATKYFAGHADVTAGLLTTSREDLAEEFRFLQINQGAVLAPFDCYSVIRGIKTLSVRFDKQVENTKEILRFLQSHAGVSSIYYAGSYSAQEQEIQTAQAKEIGAVLSFDLKEGYDLNKFLKALHIFELAPSLGGVESLIEHVASMSHQSFSKEERAALGITDTLVRLAIGIESTKDLVEDLRQALEAARQ
ncbi:PLP-dependent aspartate aminotransferase family protein [Lachnospiraceae bacterium ZAX-1]